jgi:hypothetical protein
MAAQVAFLHVVAIALAGMLAQRVDLQLQLRADVLEHLRCELRQGAGALVAEDLRNVAAGDDRRFMNGAMVLVMILATHRVMRPGAISAQTCSIDATMSLRQVEIACPGNPAGSPRPHPAGAGRGAIHRCGRCRRGSHGRHG